MFSNQYAADSSPSVSPAISMITHYLKSEPHASTSLRIMANGLNEIARKAYCSPETCPPPHIGFDLEWKPNFRPGQENPVAIIQIAHQTASYVIHVRWMRSLPVGLVEILENPRIVKVGVGIQGDAKKLYRDWGVSLTSCVDLSLFVKCIDAGLFSQRLDRYAEVEVPPSLDQDPPPPPADATWEYYNSETFLGPHIHRLFRGPYSASIGLARLAQIYEGLVLTKGGITRSNWDAELTRHQLTYAALDAYAGYAVYSRLVKLFNLLEPTKRPKRRFYAFDCIRGTLYHCSGDEKRVLLGQPTGDSETTEYPSVAEEIFLHLQGVGTDQPRGLDPWAVSNSEYDPGPLPPKRTPEEKEKLRLERRKRREDSKIAEEQDAEAKANVETMEGRGIPESTTIRRVARAAAPRPSIGRINLDAGEGPSTARTSASSVRNTKLSPTSRTSGVADATMSMRAMKFAPESPTVEDRLPALSSSTSPQGSHRRRKHNRQNRKGPSKAGEKSRV